MSPSPEKVGRPPEGGAGAVFSKPAVLAELKRLRQETSRILSGLWQRVDMADVKIIGFIVDQERREACVHPLLGTPYGIFTAGGYRFDNLYGIAIGRDGEGPRSVAVRWSENGEEKKYPIGFSLTVVDKRLGVILIDNDWWGPYFKPAAVLFPESPEGKTTEESLGELPDLYYPYILKGLKKAGGSPL